MDRKNFNKDAKLHKVCGSDDTRPALQYIYFKDGFAYATNAHICVKLSLFEICNIDEIEFLNNKLLKGESYKEILKYDLVVAKFNGLECYDEDNKVSFFYFSENDDLKFPDVEKVISELYYSKNTEVDRLMFTPLKR